MKRKISFNNFKKFVLFVEMLNSVGIEQKFLFSTAA